MSDTTPTAVELAAMRERCERATKEPWSKAESRDVFAAVIASGVATICMDCENEADADFIAASRRDLPRLLDAYERLAVERNEAQRTVASVSCILGWFDVPPRESLENNIKANRTRLENAEAEVARLQAARKEFEANVYQEETQ